MRVMSRPAPCVLFAALAAVQLASGPAEATFQQPPVDLEAFPALELDELPEHHRSWVERDVRWLITDTEREVFLRLSSDAQRNRFIEGFWLNRDPTPGTRSNEYREEHGGRLAFVTMQFSRGSPTPGWLGDRGRIYILLGEPQSVLRFPSTQLAYPMELWTYASSPELGLPPFFYVLFFRRGGFGDYRLYSPVADRPESLLNPSGHNYARDAMVAEGRTSRGRPTQYGDQVGFLMALDLVDAELSNAAISLIPATGIGADLSPLRSEMLLAQIDDLPNRVMPRADWAYPVLTGSADSNVRFETLPLEALAIGLLDPSGLPFLHYAVRAPAARLNLRAAEAASYLTFDVSSSLRSGAHVLSGEPARTVEVALEATEARQLAQGPLSYLDRIPAVPGDYVLGLMIENNVTREFGRDERRVAVPSPSPSTLSASPAILVAEHEDMGSDYDRFGSHYAFQIGRNFVLPAFDGPFPSGGTLWVFHQVYAPANSTEPLAATYTLRDAAGGVAARKATTLPLRRKDRYGVLNQLTAIPLDGVAVGRYSVDVELAIDGWRQAPLPVRISTQDEYRSPQAHAATLPPATDPGSLLTRARQLRISQRPEEALAMAQSALQRDAGSADGIILVGELLAELGRLPELRELLEPRLSKAPNDQALLLQLAEVAARLGEHRDAVRYYERARIGGADDTPELLNSLAAEYLADGESDRARELIEQSLTLLPDQPRMQGMLQRLQAGQKNR